eukprot:79876-Rhodomonas_salina.2
MVAAARSPLLSEQDWRVDAEGRAVTHTPLAFGSRDLQPRVEMHAVEAGCHVRAHHRQHLLHALMEGFALAEEEGGGGEEEEVRAIGAGERNADGEELEVAQAASRQGQVHPAHSVGEGRRAAQRGVVSHRDRLHPLHRVPDRCVIQLEAVGTEVQPESERVCRLPSPAKALRASTGSRFFCSHSVSRLRSPSNAPGASHAIWLSDRSSRRRLLRPASTPCSMPPRLLPERSSVDTFSTPPSNAVAAIPLMACFANASVEHVQEPAALRCSTEASERAKTQAPQCCSARTSRRGRSDCQTLTMP